MDSPMAQTEQLSESELCPGHLLKKQEEVASGTSTGCLLGQKSS